jgi:hypothetical protein
VHLNHSTPGSIIVGRNSQYSGRMRNVPPTAANYIQRAGRAGRRTSSTAFVLTFAQRRSHDFTHYMDPLQIIKGEIKPPYIEITNEIIVKRHMYAVALAMFWKSHPQHFGRVNMFFPTDISLLTPRTSSKNLTRMSCFSFTFVATFTPLFVRTRGPYFS